MSSNDKIIIKYGNKNFICVTNETCIGSIFTRREAEVYGRTGKRIYETLKGE